MSYKHLKKRCAGCEKTNLKMNDEHVFPQWLIFRTKTDKTKIRWINGEKINSLNATLPLCIKCNTDFGKNLENPVSKIFANLENCKGISEFEAEIIIRWLWKIEGLFWIALNPTGKYSEVYTLRERVLRPIDSIRSNLVLAISLIKNIHESFSDLPMGINSDCKINGIFVSGVFSKIAFMVVQEELIDFIPQNYLRIKLSNNSDQLSNSKLYYPKYGFENDVIAVGISIESSKILSFEHDLLAKEVLSNYKSS